MEDSKIFDSEFRTLSEAGREDSQIHIIYDGSYYVVRKNATKMVPLLLNGIKKYKIKLVTTIIQARDKLVTKERMEAYCSGQIQDLKIDDNLTLHLVNNSVNDDLETFFEECQIGKYSVWPSWSYFMPKLTTKELKLIEMRDENHLKTYSCYPKKGSRR